MKTTSNPVYPTVTAFYTESRAIFTQLHNRALALMSGAKCYRSNRSGCTDYDNMSHWSSESYTSGVSFYSDEFLYRFSFEFGGFYYDCVNNGGGDYAVYLSKSPLF